MANACVGRPVSPEVLRSLSDCTLVQCVECCTWWQNTKEETPEATSNDPTQDHPAQTSGNQHPPETNNNGSTLVQTTKPKHTGLASLAQHNPTLDEHSRYNHKTEVFIAKTDIGQQTIDGSNIKTQDNPNCQPQLPIGNKHA